MQRLEITMTSRGIAIPLCLALAVVAVYGQVMHHAFVEFDDPLYLDSLRRAPAGFGIGWAFTNDDVYLFHPITWLSYRIDLALFGEDAPGAWHATNVALHAAAVVLLYGAWRALGGARGPAAGAAALFALHPVQAEPVAWICGRKDLLAGLFLAATLRVYADWARHGGGGRYVAWNALGVLGLLSKGMLAPLPFLLLLLDYWPLRRLRLGGAGASSTARLVAEKLPLLLASLAVITVGFAFSRDAANVWVADPPLWERAFAAPHVAVQGLTRLFWPVSLSITYPSPAQMGLGPWPAERLAGSALAVLALAALTITLARTRPYLLVGFLWFLGMLVPALGIVPLGLRTLHDRYLYVPMIGVAIALAYGAADVLSRSAPRARQAAAIVAGCLLVVLAGLSARQAGVWRDSTALFDHAIAANPRDAVAHYSKGVALARAGQMAPAALHLRRALEIHPRHADAATSYGWLLLQAGRPETALGPLRLAVAIRPQWGLAQSNLGNALIAAGRVDDGLAHLEEATRVAPESADAHYWLGVALADLGRTEQAVSSLRAALAIRHDHSWAKARLAELEPPVAEGRAGAPARPETGRE